jgi:glycosyltransferase involved in cell wall biosynthesis
VTRFLWESNAPWAGTGYGAQTKLLLPALKALGHDPQMFAFYGLLGGTIEYDGYKVWPNSNYDGWGNDVINLHVERSKVEAMVTLMDLFVLDRGIWEKLSVPWAAWTPVDSVGIGDATQKMLQICEYPVAMSYFGANQMRDHDIEPAATIWHAVDCNVYKPMDKYECRALLDLDEDAYVIGMVMANKGDRKQYPLQLKAIKEWMDKNTDRKIQVYIHTEPTAMMGGWDMRELCRVLGLSGKVYATNQYDASVVPSPPQFLAQVYNACDVLMNVSAGEGFGIPIIEAQACGTPVLTGNYTSMTEITHYGYAVEPGASGLGSHFGWQFVPDIEDLLWRLECVYRMDTREAKVQSSAWARMNFDVPVIAMQWATLLERIKHEKHELVQANREWFS